MWSSLQHFPPLRRSCKLKSTKTIRILSDEIRANFLLQAYRLEPLILKHYTSKSPIEMMRASDVAKKGFQKDLNEKRLVLDVDLKSSLSKPKHQNKNKEKDSRSAELTQIKDDNFTVTLSTTRSANSPTIDQVGKKTIN